MFGPAIHHRNSPVGTRLLRAWLSIWRWMSYLYSKTSLDEIYWSSTQISTLNYRIMVCILRFLSYASVLDDSPLWRAMASTPGVFAMVVKLWMVQPRRKVDDTALASDCSGITCTLGTFIKHPGSEAWEVETDAGQVQELASMLGKDKHRIATLLLDHVRIITTLDAVWELSFPLLIDVTSTVSTNIAGILNALLSQNAMIEICRAMNIFTSTETQSPTFRYNQTVCVSKGFYYFLMAATATDGFTWITQALRSGLLTSILKLSMWNKKLATALEVVLDVIVPYTAYWLVLRVLGRILADSKFCRLEAQLHAGVHFQRKWVSFKSIVDENLSVKAIFDAGGKYSQKCAASGVHITLTNCSHF